MTRVGDFEIDTIIGSNRKGAITTAVDRNSKLVKISIPTTKKADEVEREIRRIFDLLYVDNPLDEMLEQMEKLFLTNTIVIRPNRKSKSRLDKDTHKSTIATNSINHLKRKMSGINWNEALNCRLYKLNLMALTNPLIKINLKYNYNF